MFPLHQFPIFGGHSSLEKKTNAIGYSSRPSYKGYFSQWVDKSTCSFKVRPTICLAAALLLPTVSIDPSLTVQCEGGGHTLPCPHPQLRGLCKAGHCSMGAVMWYEQFWRSRSLLYTRTHTVQDPQVLILHRPIAMKHVVVHHSVLSFVPPVALQLWVYPLTTPLPIMLKERFVF